MNQDEHRALSKRLRDLKRDFATRELPRTFKQLVVALLDHVNVTTQECFPSQSRLASIVGVSIRSVQRNLQAIERLGLFTVRKGRGQRHSTYVLRLDSKAWQKAKTGAVAEVASKYAAKGKGVVTRASILNGQRVSTERRDGIDARVALGIDAVSTRASHQLPIGSVVGCSEACTPHHEHELNGEKLAAAPLAGTAAARLVPPNDSQLAGDGDDFFGDWEEFLQELDKEEAA